LSRSALGEAPQQREGLHQHLLLVEAGPGGLSLDAARGRERAGSRWALAALLTGALGALAAHAAAAAAPLPPAEANAG
jgi:hypothetical protein